MKANSFKGTSSCGRCGYENITSPPLPPLHKRKPLQQIDVRSRIRHYCRMNKAPPTAPRGYIIGKNKHNRKPSTATERKRYSGRRHGGIKTTSPTNIANTAQALPATTESNVRPCDGTEESTYVTLAPTVTYTRARRIHLRQKRLKTLSPEEGVRRCGHFKHPATPTQVTTAPIE